MNIKTLKTLMNTTKGKFVPITGNSEKRWQ